MEGALPENTGEIAIDRMYADNKEISRGRYSGKQKINPGQ